MSETDDQHVPPGPAVSSFGIETDIPFGIDPDGKVVYWTPDTSLSHQLVAGGARSNWLKHRVQHPGKTVFIEGRPGAGVSRLPEDEIHD